jgi:hypothetical protein
MSVYSNLSSSTESLEHLRKLYAAHDLLHRRQLERIRAALSDGAAGA